MLSSSRRMFSECHVCWSITSASPEEKGRQSVTVWKRLLHNLQDADTNNKASIASVQKSQAEAEAAWERESFASTWWGQGAHPPFHSSCHDWLHAQELFPKLPFTSFSLPGLVRVIQGRRKKKITTPAPLYYLSECKCEYQKTHPNIQCQK